jgi:O-antigen/teichoic acid export membrane protein
MMNATATVISAAQERIGRFRGPALRGVADQALTSAENFAVGIILVRNCTKAEFGLYVLGYGMLVLCWSLIAALITAQMPAAFSRGALSLEERQMLCGSLLHSLLVTSAATAGCGCILAMLLTQLNIVAAPDIYYWLLLASALPGICLRDFMRRYFFQERSEARALLMDGLALALTIMTLGTMAALHATHLNSVAAATLALGGLGVGIWGIVAGDLSPERHRDEPVGSLRSSWQSGRWNIGATFVSWVQTQAYTFFVTAMLGLSGLATANAPRVLLTPITLLSTGLALPLLPQFAKQRTNLDSVVGVRAVGVLAGAMGALVGLYTFALWLGRDAFLPLILGRRYDDIWPCLIAWAIANVFTNIRVYYSTFLLAKGSFRRLAAVNVFSALAVIAVTGLLIHLFGVVGSVYSLAVGELLLGMAIWHQCGIVATRIQAS